MGIFVFDDEIRSEGYRRIAGVDEAGRGPLAGPVVASAVILKEDIAVPGLDDSKKLSSNRISALFRDLLSLSVSIGVGMADPVEIDRLNILNATKKAMINALDDLSVTPDIVLIDALALDACSLPQRSIIKGDGKSASIAAASIVAKYVRDSIMEDYHKSYPVYGFNSHKGYATKAHREMLEKHGPCPIHRRSFSPVASLYLPFGAF